DALITVNQDLRTKIVELGIASGKIHVVPRGVDGELFSPADRKEARRRLGLLLDGRMLLWVGRMVTVKGLDVLLQACAKLRADRLAFRLHLVGDGPLRQQLEADCQSKGLAEVVSFVGPVDHCQLPDWY